MWGGFAHAPWMTVSRETVVAGELSDPVLPTHLFQFHPSVLEPDFDLPVSEVHTAADLQTALPCQVHVEEKLLLQLQSLVLGVGAALLSATLCRQPVSRAFHFSISCDESETWHEGSWCDTSKPLIWEEILIWDYGPTRFNNSTNQSWLSLSMVCCCFLNFYKIIFNDYTFCFTSMLPQNIMV